MLIPGLLPAAHLQKSKSLIPRLYWPKFEAENEARREDFYRRLCMLFIPWRNEAELKNPFNYFEERWKNFMNGLKVVSQNAYNDITAVM